MTVPVARHGAESPRGADRRTLRPAAPVVIDPNVTRVSAADDAIDLTTAFVMGFVIEEQERSQSAEADPERYSLAGRDAWLGKGFLLVSEAGHARDDGDERFERQLGIVLDGVGTRLNGRDPAVERPT